MEYPEAHKSIRPDADAKSVRLDVYVSDDKGTVYDIEMQMTDTKELPKRTRYYQSMIDLQLIDRVEYYKNLKPVLDFTGRFKSKKQLMENIFCQLLFIIFVSIMDCQRKA